NRRVIEQMLPAMLRAAIVAGSPLALVMLDVDHFKRVNDEHGHKAGDAVLRGLVQLLRHRARAVDLLFRMGGEEFVLLLPDTPEDAAAGVAEELRQAIAATALLDGKVVTASLGVAAARPDDTVESWLRAADAAMYAAKEAGRNRVARRA
ncbi:MAG TPA: GGDEF domain-containing protein, partial [Vicinamibacteria bacterium]